MLSSARLPLEALTVPVAGSPGGQQCLPAGRRRWPSWLPLFDTCSPTPPLPSAVPHCTMNSSDIEPLDDSGSGSGHDPRPPPPLCRNARWVPA